jgi:hypothetical protein
MYEPAAEIPSDVEGARTPFLRKLSRSLGEFSFVQRMPFYAGGGCERARGPSTAQLPREAKQLLRSG